MRNELNNLVAGIEDPVERKAFDAEMSGFFTLFNRFLSDRAKGEKLVWDKIKPPSANQIIPYEKLPEATSPKDALNKLAVLKLNGGLGTTMGCVGPKAVIEVRDGMTFLDLSVRQIEVGNPFSFFLRTNADFAHIRWIAPQLGVQRQRAIHPDELIQHGRGHCARDPKVRKPQRPDPHLQPIEVPAHQQGVPAPLPAHPYFRQGTVVPARPRRLV